MSPFRNVPVVNTTYPAAIRSPFPSMTPAALPAWSSSRSSAAPSSNVEVRRFGQQIGNGAAVELAVGLSARPAHRRPLAAVEDAELNTGAVDRAAHDTIERIDLADEMTLAKPADRRIARHLADRRDAVGQ